MPDWGIWDTLSLQEELAGDSRTDAVTKRLRRLIRDGHVRSGEPLRQAAVASALGVSKVPVREALRRLEAEGLVVITPNSGARVAVLDFEHFLEACTAQGIPDEMCWDEANRFLDACMMNCEEPPPPDPDCEQVCEEAFDMALRECLASGQDPAQCEMHAHELFQTCLANCR